MVLAVRDGEIAELAERLARDGGPWEGRVALHLSGAVGSDALRALRSRGACIASAAPLAILASSPGEHAGRVPPLTTWLAEGDARALDVARAMAMALGGSMAIVPLAMKPLCHAAATLAGNLAAVLVAGGAEALRAAGIEGGAALLAPLAHASIGQVALRGDLSGLTGPVARGDDATLSAHVRALREAGLPPEVVEAHVAASLLAVALLRRARLPDAGLDRVERLLRSPDPGAPSVE